MANPQPDRYMRMSNELNDAILITDFSKRQRKIIDLVIRMSYGCNKKTALIKPSEFETIGVRKGHIQTELDYLVNSKVLIVDGDVIQLNKNYDQWRVSLVSTYKPDKFKELLHRNLSVTKTVTKVTETVTDEEEEKDDELPKQELGSYQNSNHGVTKTVTDTAFETNDTNGSEPPKDIIKDIIKDINNNNDSFLDSLKASEEDLLIEEAISYYQIKQGRAGFPFKGTDIDWIKIAIKEGFSKLEIIDGINQAFLSAGSSINSFEYCLKTMRTKRDQDKWNQMKKERSYESTSAKVPVNSRSHGFSQGDVGTEESSLSDRANQLQKERLRKLGYNI